VGEAEGEAVGSGTLAAHPAVSIMALSATAATPSNFRYRFISSPLLSLNTSSLHPNRNKPEKNRHCGILEGVAVGSNADVQTNKERNEETP
jgi:hypothetical protein